MPKRRNVFTLKEVNARRKRTGKRPWTRKRYNEAISTVKK